MIGEICWGLAGAALWTAAYQLGRLTAIRKEKHVDRACALGGGQTADNEETARRLKEFANFLNYDGSEMPDHEERNGGGKV